MAAKGDPCPFLPSIDKVWRARDMAAFRERRDEEFYLAALCYAQSLLREGKPAQALLQINKSFLADLSEEPILENWPPAYEAVSWIILRFHAQGEQFLGNPVRHYQHLASRMSGARSEVRTLRAWACFHLAQLIAPSFSRDEKQIREEALVIPKWEELLPILTRLGWKGEGDVLRGTLERLRESIAR